MFFPSCIFSTHAWWFCCLPWAGICNFFTKHFQKSIQLVSSNFSSLNLSDAPLFSVQVFEAILCSYELRF
jgi:hypothetical protein